MQESEFYRFSAGELMPCRDSVSEIRLAAADSFLVDSGRVRSFEAHCERFAQWVIVTSPQLAEALPTYFKLAKALIPITGRWFPRFELHLASPADGPDVDSLYLRLRTAPEQLGDAVLWTLDEVDPRLNPTVKGPDLSLCMQLRRKAQLHGADEAVLLDANGYLSEGALSSLVWWNGDVLCAPNEQTHWLRSITRDEVFGIAQAIGYQTRLEHVRPADLVGAEIWVLSSLQGIRAVSSWKNLGSPVGAASHLEQFQKRLRMLAGSLG
ncbi:MAG: hypothetical protein RL243_212 [Actinomycetota bacterium]